MILLFFSASIFGDVFVADIAQLCSYQLNDGKKIVTVVEKNGPILLTFDNNTRIKKTHIVLDNEKLYHIARAHDLLEVQLCYTNALSCIDPEISVGDEISIPDTSWKDQRYITIASWYIDTTDRPLADGDVYDENEIFIAHRTLPLGETIRVTNLQNGKHINAVVKDRGPYIAERTIDLSKAAAQSLHVNDHGIIPVLVDTHQ
jgi:hypothetical protein